MEEQKYILALVGITMSGKTTIMKEIIKVAETQSISIHRILPFTTRPMREEDKIEPDNIFVDESKFNEIVSIDEFYSTSEFTISNGKIYYYGITKEALHNAKKINIVISNPTEIEQLESNLPLKYTLLPLSLNVSKEELDKRYKDATDRGEDEVANRIKRDWDFYSEFSNKSDVFNVNVSNRTPQEIATEIFIELINFIVRN